MIILLNDLEHVELTFRYCGRSTYCDLRISSATRPGKYHIKVKRHPKERHCKFNARKAALTKLFGNLNGVYPYDILSKEERTIIWLKCLSAWRWPRNLKR
jgi:hypothetical protein